MLTRDEHRRTIRHFEGRLQAHGLTFGCLDGLALLDDDEHRRMLSQAISRAVERHAFRLLAFVYMPNHVHLVVLPRSEDASIARLLYAIKRPFSFRMKQMLRGHEIFTRLHRHGRFRFWQRGPGYDRNFRSPEGVRNAIDYIHLNPVRAGICEGPDEYRWSSWRQWHRPEEWRDPWVPVIERIWIG